MAVRRLIAPLATVAVLVAGCGGAHPGVIVRTLPIAAATRTTHTRTPLGRPHTRTGSATTHTRTAPATTHTRTAPGRTHTHTAPDASSRSARIPRRLLREARPIGRGPAFHPPVRGRVLGRCRPGLGRRVAVHLELFAADRVVLVASGIGIRGPDRRSGGRIVAARCYGALVTVDPTGVLQVRRGVALTVGDVFRSWGRPLGRRRMLSFRGRVRAYVNGRRWHRTAPSAIALRRHAEIVLEVGPHVPPHRTYHFPPGG